ncbi:MAG: class I SAM-dependent methyltransferase [Desulfobacterales bacterium]|nr:class I SAM-dependent methyltransferase [Desulfobacterales bacterium]
MLSVRQFPPYPTYDHHQLKTALQIQPHERVLDIGGGHNPVTFAHVVLDIDFNTGIHRDGTSLSIDKIQHDYVQGDVMDLPFADKSFDVVICLHVLEHTSDPQKACEEMMRVAKRGYVEVPRKWTELYAGHPTHRWLIDDCNGKILFEPITYTVSPFMNFALPAVWNSKELVQQAYEIHLNVPCIQFEWQDRFAYEVTGQCNNQLFENTELAKRHYAFARHVLYWGASPNYGLFHAEQAHRLLPNQKEYEQLYLIYLAFSGQWLYAVRNGLGIKPFLIAVIGKVLLLVNRSVFTWFRRLLKHMDEFHGR